MPDVDKNADEIKYGIKDVYDDHDLRYIVNSRILRRFLKMIFEVVNRTDKKEISFKMEKMEELLEKVLDKELAVFTDEFDRYKKKFKIDIFKDLKEAREGDNRSLRHLLQWDRTWLKMGWVTDRIIDAQNTYDFKLIAEFGDALNMKPGCITKSKHRDLLEQLKPFCDATGFGDGEIKSIRGMWEFLCERDIIDDELRDFDYFVKYLRRYNVIP